MLNSDENIEQSVRTGQLLSAIDSGTQQQVRHLLNSLSPVEIARIIEASPPRTRDVIWQLLDTEIDGEVLQELGDEVQAQFLRSMDPEQVVAITEGLQLDDIADILQQLPNRLLHQVLQAMDEQNRHRIESVLTFDEDTAGGLMNIDTITVRPKHSLDVVLRYLRRHDELPEATDTIFVVNKDDKLVGTLPLRRVLVTDPAITVREIMLTDMAPIPALMPAREVANLFERHNWISAPVVDDDGRLLGRITIDDVVDVIIEDADHSLMGMAGLGEDEDTFAPVLKAAPRRAIWLGINLLTAFIASAVINIFEQTIDKVVALAVLMPIVASMGGVAGSQTLTVVIRGMATGQISRTNAGWLINREVQLAALNGLLWALVAAIAAALWFSDPLIGVLIASAMLINLSVASLAGVLLPLAMKIIKIDPALAGSVILTTVTDAVGFLSFLGLATYFYA